MKFIFDFDDVLFNTVRNFREQMMVVLEKVGISRDQVKEYCEKERWNQFSLKKMLVHFSVNENLYEKIMSKNAHFLNQELIEIIKKIGRQNCYIVTYGDEEFQSQKIKTSGISELFSDIIIVTGSKKEAVEKICAEYKDEKVIFVDDRAVHFEDLDFKKCPNLKTILFDEQGLEKLKKEIEN